MADQEDGQRGFDPKHRIAGAIILVSLGVIFIPAILDQREPVTAATNPDALIQIPARSPAAEPDETRVVVSRLDAPARPPASTIQDSPVPPAAVPPRPAEPAGSAPGSATAAEQPVAKKPEIATAATKPAVKPAAGGWVIQVGTFANFDNAVRLREELRRHGHVVSTENISLGGSKAMRLRVGPFPDKAEALKVQERIKQETGVQGVVLANR